MGASVIHRALAPLRDLSRGTWLAVFAAVVVTGNLCALVDRFHHSELPYFELHHLIVGSVTAFVTGAFLLLFAVSRDGYLKAKKALELKNILLSTQLETTLDGILAVDREMRMISFNNRFVEMWGIPPEVVESRSDKLALRSMCEKLREPQQFLARVRYLYEHPREVSRDEIDLVDGRIFERYTAPMTGMDNAYYGRVWYFRDITDCKNAVCEQADQKLFYHQILEDSPDLICRWRHDGTITYVNENYRTYFGLLKEDVIGKKYWPLIPEEDRLKRECYIEEISAEHPVFEIEYRVILPDGSTR